MIELFSIDFVMASTEQLLALTRVARTSAARLASLRTIWFGGSVPTRTLLEAATIHLCNNILCRYAASETGLVAQATAREMLNKPGLVGRVVPGVEVGIFDRAGGRCPLGQIGVVKVRCGADGEDRGDDGAGRRQGWVDLGDLGWIDSERQLYVVGRVSDSGGIATGALSPVHEIEHILRLEWDVADAAAVMADDVGEAAQVWIGIVDNKGASAENLAAILRSRGYHYPIRLFDLRAIPRGSNGKVNRQQLKALMLGAKAGAGTS
jgi:long-chain acyl-CoA synthetase